MDLTLSEEQRLIVDTVRAFVEKELYPHEDEVERLDEVMPIPYSFPYLAGSFLRRLSCTFFQKAQCSFQVMGIFLGSGSNPASCTRSFQ